MRWRYHPQEIGCLPAPGAEGLPERLARALQERRPTGWVRHGGAYDARPGNHASAPRDAGLHAALVANGRSTLFTLEGHPDLALQRALLRSCDLAVIEGNLDGSCPLVVGLDAEGVGLERVREEDVERVVALVGPRPPRARLPPGGIPRFDAASEEDLVDHLLDLLETRGRGRPLVGVLLASADDRPEALAESSRILEAVCGRVVRVDDLPATVPGAERVPPSHPGWGEAGRILTAFEAFPDAALLVLDAAQPATRVERLLAQRDPLAVATAFRSRDTHMPEPGAILWEPRARDALAAALAGGSGCERRALVQSGTALLDS